MTNFKDFDFLRSFQSFFESGKSLMSRPDEFVGQISVSTMALSKLVNFNIKTAIPQYIKVHYCHTKLSVSRITLYCFSLKLH